VYVILGLLPVDQALGIATDPFFGLTPSRKRRAKKSRASVFPLSVVPQFLEPSWLRCLDGLFLTAFRPTEVCLLRMQSADAGWANDVATLAQLTAPRTAALGRRGLYSTPDQALWVLVLKRGGWSAVFSACVSAVYALSLPFLCFFLGAIARGLHAVMKF
jgi:hypothetical protein